MSYNNFQTQGITLTLLFVLTILGVTTADFDCVCSINSHQNIYASPSNIFQIIGEIYRTCKAVATITRDAWVLVFYNHQVGGHCMLKRAGKVEWSGVEFLV